MGHGASRPGVVLTRRQRQDELVKMCPGSAKVIHRPNTNPDGSEIVAISDYEFPALSCEDFVKSLREGLLGRDDDAVRLFRDLLQSFCGIQVDLDADADADAAINNNNGSATP